MNTAKRKVRYLCPLCNGNSTRYEKEDLIIHITDTHENDLPEDFTPFRYVFNYVNKKPLSYHGKCTECGGPTPWDENKGRYNRQCGKKACHDSFVKRFEDNMVKTKGVTRMSKTIEGQVEMLANRKISGKYKFQNGVEKTYTGSYEKKALEFMDKVMNIDPDDIMCPGLILEYEFSGKKYMYITDFYYQPYDLIIEVKDGGDNPNNRNMPEYRAKQEAKEKFIIKNTKYNYLRLTDNDFSQLLSVFLDLKMQMVDNSFNRVIHINENYLKTDIDNPIHEFMGMGSYAPMIGIKSSDAYIINKPNNNVFSSSIMITDGKLDSIFGLDSNSVLVKESISKELYEEIKASDLYRIGTSADISAKLSKIRGNVMTETEMFESITGSELYTLDQLPCQFPVINNISRDEYLKLNYSLERYLLDDVNEIESVVETAREVMNYGQI